MSSTDKCVGFLQELIQTRSMSGEEGEIASLVSSQMSELGYDEVSSDEAGNVIGLVRGLGTAPTTMFNTHLDHVDAGDPSDWPHDPFGGEVHDGVVWGRGAVDIKGPLAAQVFGVARLIESGDRPPGDVYVTSVVQEEVGGLGARHMAETLAPDLIMIGEPSRNEVRRGHRGRVELQAHVRGRMAHASMTSIGRNPLEVIGRFLSRLDEIDLPNDPNLGRSTVAPTLIRTDQTSANVIPGEVALTLDCRTVAGQNSRTLSDALGPLLSECEIEGTSSQICIPEEDNVSYAGLEMTYSAEHPSLSLSADHMAVQTAVQVLAGALGSEPPVGVWDFATDGGHFAEAGRTVVGFGPGDDRLAHTVSEHIHIQELEIGIRGNEALARNWATQFAAAS